MDSHRLFIKTPPLKLFLIAALPGMISMVASSLYQLIDGIFVGRILGETSFAALNLAMPFVIINFAIADLVGVGSSVPISINLGKGQGREANNIFTCACLLIVGSGIIMGAALYLAAPALMHLMGAEGEFADQAAQYLRVYAICSPVTTIVFAMDNFLRICGKIHMSMVLNIVMSASIVLFEFLFLFIFRWGIWSAALAACLGMIISALIALVPFLRRKTLLKFCLPHFSAALIRRIIACGTPNFLSNIAGRITSILMNFFLVRMGGQTAVSIYGILMYADGIVQSILYGICDSLQPAVGYNWGAGEKGRVKAIEKCCFSAAGIFSLAAAVILFAFPEQTTVLFMGGSDGDFLELSAFAVRLFSLTYITRWFSFATQSYMLAIEKPLQATVISLSTSFVFPVILIFALQPLALTGLWLNFAATSFMAAVVAAVILVQNTRKAAQKR